jgi:hypothetical protein
MKEPEANFKWERRISSPGILFFTLNFRPVADSLGLDLGLI